MEQTLKLTGIFPVGETVEHATNKATRAQKKEDAKFEKLRNKIIEQTIGIAYEQIEQDREFVEQYKGLTDFQKMIALRNNAIAAEKAKGKNKTNALLLGLSWGLSAVTSFLAPGLAWVPHIISAITTAKALRDAYKASKGFSSDALLKGGDYDNAFESFYNNKYLPKIKLIDNDREMLLEKQKTMSKKEFKEYMDKYCTAIADYQGQNKGEE